VLFYFNFIISFIAEHFKKKTDATESFSLGGVLRIMKKKQKEQGTISVPFSGKAGRARSLADITFYLPSVTSRRKVL
jgi:hypothetical protein